MSAELLSFRKNIPQTRELIPFEKLRGQYGPYIAEPALVHAANTALGLQMPLLLTGEPGCGKSDFAWVAALSLGHSEPMRFHVRSDTRARDLLYYYDALVRFGDMQHGKHVRAEDPRHYISLRPLGAALMSPGQRPVVLVDEIDKAPRDLPNDLLHEIDEGWFEIPEVGDLIGDAPIFDRMHKNIEIKRDMKRPSDKAKPLVIITSNAERQLPEAFLRRCLFFHIPPPNSEQLIKIAQARFEDQPPALTKDLASIFYAFRKDNAFTKPPTTAEMLNWISALVGLHESSEVYGAIQPFAEAVSKGERKLPWNKLPALTCLLKMAEDLEAVGARVT